jgi:hypothetical protein
LKTLAAARPARRACVQLISTRCEHFSKNLTQRKKMQVKENIKESDRCNCGRSPTGECIGCYFLTGAEFDTRLAEYLAEQQHKNQAVGT